MSEEFVRRVIEERLSTVIDGAVPIAWDDQDYTPTAGVDFIEPTFECVGSENIALKCERNHYLFTILVNTKKGKGSTTNLLLADKIKDGFVYQIFEGVTFQGGQVKRGGQHKQFYQRRVLLDFYYNNTRS